MPHSLMPNQNYFIANIKLAIADSSADSVIDGLNDWLRNELDNGFVDDYLLVDGEEMTQVSSGDNPEEGDLFHTVKTYAISVIDPEHEEMWTKVRTALPLSTMNEDELCTHIAPLFEISTHDWYEGDYKVSIGCIDEMSTMTI